MEGIVSCAEEERNLEMVKFNRFKEISGSYVSEITGQSRLGYSISDTVDFYDMIEWSKRGDYRGSIILFYDYDNREIYKPFKQQKNVLYGSPVFLKESYWFLQGDFNKKKITLFRYLPDNTPEMITQLDTDKVELNNLRITGEDIHITSEDDDFKCYYPLEFGFAKDIHEGVDFIADGKVYMSSWVEEGWDTDSNCPTENYEYYDKMVVRDFSGNLISEERGSLFQRDDGSWWIA